MAKVKVLARNWVLEVDTDPLATTPTGSPVWTKIGGLTTFTISSDKEDADTTDFDSNGRSEHLVASRSNEISLEGQYIEDPADNSRDAGQSAVETYAEYIGQESIVPMRITSPSGKTTEYNGSFATGDVGGGVNDPTSWGATFTPSGEKTTVTP